jgi:histidine triad (HIT) family protein
MNEDCIFCRIVKGETDTKIIKESERLIVFKDISPQAPIHLLIVAKKHIQDITRIDEETWNEIKDVATGIAKARSIPGFRLVHNAGDASLVKHIHVHFLGEVSGERKL